MNTVTAPIATTTTLSILLHVAVVAVVFLLIEQAASTGEAVEFELLSSYRISDQQAMVASSNKAVVENNRIAPPVKPNIKKAAKKILTANTSTAKTALDREKKISQRITAQEPVHNQQAAAKVSTPGIAQAGKASEQKHTIIELLHDSISRNKEYPYLARRQRREGVATVGFVLHPDGTINNARLVASSRARILDRAALAAVKHIEPFAPARNYIHQAEEFRIDVVFKLL